MLGGLQRWVRVLVCSRAMLDRVLRLAPFDNAEWMERMLQISLGSGEVQTHKLLLQ